MDWDPREKECKAIVAALLKWCGWVGNQRVEVRTDRHSLDKWATDNLKTVGDPSPRHVVGMNDSLNFTSMLFKPLGP